MDYLYLKSLHIIAVIAWMAGLLYLPRLFVYHADVDVGSLMDQTFQIMERRLNKAIMVPAAIVTWLCGLGMVVQVPSLLNAGWLQAKVLLVVLMTGGHGLLFWHVQQFRTGENHYSSRYFRIINEIPTVLMIAVVVLAVVRPF